MHVERKQLKKLCPQDVCNQFIGHMQYDNFFFRRDDQSNSLDIALFGVKINSYSCVCPLEQCSRFQIWSVKENYSWDGLLAFS